MAEGSGELMFVGQLSSALASQASTDGIIDVIATHLRRVIPSCLCVFYLYNSATDELEAQYAVGDGAMLVLGFRITLGQRLSGWVAANRQTVINSDALLDLSDRIPSTALVPKSCLSTPLVSDDALIGTLSLYSTQPDAFSNDHGHMIEAAAPQVADALAQRMRESSQQYRSVELPHIDQLENFIDSFESNESENDFNVFIVISTKNQLASGGLTSDEALGFVAKHARDAFREGDILFRGSNNDVVAFLRSTDAHTADQIAKRVRDTLERSRLRTGTRSALALQFSVSVVDGDRDGQSFAGFPIVARKRGRSVGLDPSGTRVH